MGREEKQGNYFGDYCSDPEQKLLGQSSSSKWSDSGYNLKAKPMEFAERLDVTRCKRYLGAR